MQLLSGFVMFLLKKLLSDQTLIFFLKKDIKGCADDWGSSDCNQTVGGIRPRGWFQPTGFTMLIFMMMKFIMMIMVIRKGGFNQRVL